MAITRLNNNSITSVTTLPSGVGGKILQIQQNTWTTKISQAITNNATLTDGSNNIGVSITPTSTSNKILVTFNIGRLNASNITSTGYGLGLTLLRNGSAIANNTDGGNTPSCTFYGGVYAYAYSDRGVSFSYLDSPSTTSEVTYTLNALVHVAGTFTVVLNGFSQSTTATTNGHQAGAITAVQAIEIAG